MPLFHKQIKLTRTTRDIGSMLYQSTLEDDQETLFNNYKKNRYYQKSKDALKEIERTEKAYKDTLERNFGERLATAVQKKISQKMLEVFLPGVLVDNLAAKLIVDEVYDITEENVQTVAYNKFYEATINGISLAQEIGSSIRGEDFYYHIGIGNSRKINVFQLDLEAMHEFEKNQKIFELQQNKSGNFTFGTKVGLKGKDIIESLQDIVRESKNDKTTRIDTKAKTNKNGQTLTDLWAKLRDTQETKITYRSGKSVRAADRFELFESSIIDQLYGTDTYSDNLAQYLGGRSPYKHDSTSGYAAGDVYRTREQLGTAKGIGIQSKFFNTELDNQKRRFNITSVNALKEALTIYSDKKQMTELIEETRVQSWEDAHGRGLFPEDVGKNAQSTEEELYDQYSEIAHSHAKDWIESYDWGSNEEQ